DNAIVHKRPAVRDSNRGALAIIKVCHPHHGVEWQRAMRRGELIHVVDFAVRSAPPMKGLTVPRSVSLLGVPGRSRRRNGPVSFWRCCRPTGGCLRNIRRAFRRFFGPRRRARGLRRRWLSPCNRPPPSAAGPSQGQQKQSSRAKIKDSAHSLGAGEAGSPPAPFPRPARPLGWFLQGPPAFRTGRILLISANCARRCVPRSSSPLRSVSRTVRAKTVPCASPFPAPLLLAQRLRCVRLPGPRVS